MLTQVEIDKRMKAYLGGVPKVTPRDPQSFIYTNATASCSTLQISATN